MSRPAAKAHGDLVIELTPAQVNDTHRNGVRPRVGTIVNLWQLAGRWGVWSEGPRAGTWWLSAQDEDAKAVAAACEAKQSRGEPVVVQARKGCIAVRSNAIKPSGWTGR